jgi:hypothetical protein
MGEEMKLLLKAIRQMLFQILGGITVAACLVGLFFLFFWPAYVWSNSLWVAVWWLFLWFCYTLFSIGVDKEEQKILNGPPAGEKIVMGFAAEDLECGDAVVLDPRTGYFSKAKK